MNTQLNLLNEELIDLKGMKCWDCGCGTFEENSIQCDWHGYLVCTECYLRVTWHQRCINGIPEEQYNWKGE